MSAKRKLARAFHSTHADEATTSKASKKQKSRKSILAVQAMSKTTIDRKGIERKGTKDKHLRCDDPETDLAVTICTNTDKFERRTYFGIPPLDYHAAIGAEYGRSRIPHKNVVRIRDEAVDQLLAISNASCETTRTDGSTVTFVISCERKDDWFKQFVEILGEETTVQDAILWFDHNNNKPVEKFDEERMSQQPCDVMDKGGSRVDEGAHSDKSSVLSGENLGDTTKKLKKLLTVMGQARKDSGQSYRSRCLYTSSCGFPLYLLYRSLYFLVGYPANVASKFRVGFNDLENQLAQLSTLTQERSTTAKYSNALHAVKRALQMESFGITLTRGKKRNNAALASALAACILITLEEEEKDKLIATFNLGRKKDTINTLIRQNFIDENYVIKPTCQQDDSCNTPEEEQARELPKEIRSTSKDGPESSAASSKVEEGKEGECGNAVKNYKDIDAQQLLDLTQVSHIYSHML